jgi:hexosaminidase
MPGHSAEVFAAFPELSCTGKRNIVPVVWGDGVFCAGNDSTFVFLENVLDEVAELFPSKYIHIGGDEVNKKYWRKCAKCQKRIRDNNLKDENELQSWFVKKIEKYLNGKGKRLIGWDEILEGGIAPEATVMSWRGVKGGVESAEQGHDVIMCPGSHCYFDHYQADPDFEPEAIGGYLPLKKVYAFNPVPNELSDDKAHFVLGGQGNVWTEFIFTPEHAEYMALPRMTALAEVLWTPKDEQNWNDFQKRLITQFKRFDAMGVNYSKGTFKIDVKVAKRQDGNFRVALEGEQLLPIYYTLDGTVPNQNSPVYSSPFEINKTTVIKSAYLNDDGEVIRKVSEKTVYKHKAVGKEIVLKSPPAKRYFGQGPLSLVDGFTASDNYADGYWLGFRGKDMEAEIDLGEMLPVHSVSETFLQSARVWIFMPEKVSFILLDENRKAVAEKTVTVKSDIKTDKTFIESFKAVFNNVKARYIKVHAYSLIKCPEWHTAAGNNCWIFTDEIAVE